MLIVQLRNCEIEATAATAAIAATTAAVNAGTVTTAATAPATRGKLTGPLRKRWVKGITKHLLKAKVWGTTL